MRGQTQMVARPALFVLRTGTTGSQQNVLLLRYNVAGLSINVIA